MGPSVKPGDLVYIRVFWRKLHQPRWEGLYQVVRATPTAVQVEGSTTLYHLNHCTKSRTKEDERTAAEEEDEKCDKTENNDSNIALLPNVDDCREQSQAKPRTGKRDSTREPALLAKNECVNSFKC